MRSIASKLMMRMLIAAAVILAIGVAVIFQIRTILFEEAASELMQSKEQRVTTKDGNRCCGTLWYYVNDTAIS
ncbi:MAG TPA: hypothetical protein PK283_01370 [Thiotrichales bacterium]|nr:MAG: hypothetical protein B7Y18_02565 [Thiotrichales bacterium 24-47-4]UCG19040.1 MAG: hypothetical protein JSU84_02145 [Thiotrichales bacterium]HQR81534.1 hypothetical protein [Thiotrichales bacterium]HQR95113.1 hypothetical protein [Thiotrichales bacterium]